MAEIDTRFVILCGARTGSTALTYTLDSHPDVHCHNNPFYVNPHGISGLPDWLQKRVDMTKRETDPMGFVTDIFAASDGATKLGFKLWKGVAEGSELAVQALATDTGIKKIILDRANHLSITSSAALVALKKREPQAFADPDTPPQVDFDKTGFVQDSRRRKHRLDSYRAMARGDVLEIEYNGLMTKGLRDVSGFLGLAEFDFVPQTQKRNSPDILGRFKPRFHDEIKVTLDELGHPEWVHETE